MAGSYEKCRDLLNLSYVQRWVIAPMYRPQSVAEHSYRVAIIAMSLLSYIRYHTTPLPPIVMGDVLYDALVHDADEVFTGDVPGTSKDKTKAWTDPKSLSPWELIVKVADSIETLSYWREWLNPNWNHPMSPYNRGDGGRDVRKIYHYSQHWPVLLEAAQTLCNEVFHIDLEEIWKAVPDSLKEGPNGPLM